MKNNIIDYLEETTKKYPNHVAFLENENKKITFEQLLNKSKVIATNILKKYGYGNEPIAIFIEKSVECTEAMFGTMYSNYFHCVLDTESPLNRLETIIKTLEPVLIITNKKNYDKLKGYSFGIDILVIEDINDTIDEKLLDNIHRNDADIAYALFTSGSTGIPKGTVINSKSLIEYTEWFKNTFKINSRTVFGSQTPLYFSMCISDVYSTIMTGATYCIIPKINFSFPIKLVEYLDKYKINTIYWVPSALCLVANLKTFDYVKPKYLKKVLFCGEVMPMPQLNIWRKNIPNAMYANLFGPTETVDVCTYYIVNRNFDDSETLPIGNACEGTTILMINDENKLASHGEIGELYVKGSIVGNGYYNNKEKTEAAFVQNPLHDKYIDIVYKTGDIGRLNKYGEIEYLGRKDYQIKHMGYRIELGEIETNYNSLDGITICACIYDDKNSNIVLFYESNSLSDDILYKFADDKLVKYMRPNKIIKLKKMIYNANGKIDRTKLKSNYMNGEY